MKLLLKLLIIVAGLQLFSMPSTYASDIDSLKLIPSALIVPPQFASLYDSAHTVMLPAGYECHVVYAQNGWGPRALALRPDGVVCVSDAGNSHIVALNERDGNLTSCVPIVIAYEDHNAHGFAFYNGSLYTAAADFVRRYDHPDTNGIYQDSSTFIANIPYLAEGAPNHTTRTILFDTIGKAIYLSVGAPCNACRETDTERAAILRFNLDGTGRRVYAAGLRNAVGLDIDNVTHTLWASVAERNSLGADVPQEFAAKIVDRGWYGWPISYGDHEWIDFNADSEYHAMLPTTHNDSILVQSMQVADLFFPAHSTPLGIAVYHRTAFPGCDSSLFITLHGSAPGPGGRLIADGSKIERAKEVNGTWVIEDFATGFLTDSINYKRWVRPCGIVIDTLGNLYFSSDHADAHTPPAVYKITYTGSKGVHSPNELAVSMNVFPDPVRSACRVELTGVAGSAHVSVMNLLGQVVFSREMNREITLDLSSLANATYLVRVTAGPTTIEKKIVIER